MRLSSSIQNHIIRGYQKNILFLFFVIIIFIVSRNKFASQKQATVALTWINVSAAMALLNESFHYLSFCYQLL